MNRSTLRLAAAGLGATLALSGCSFNASFGEKSVKQADVESRISAEITAQTMKQNTVRCPGDLKGKVGATMECTALIDTLTYPVAVNVTSVEGSTVNYSFKMAKQPASGAASQALGTQDRVATNIDVTDEATDETVEETTDSDETPYPGSEYDSTPTAGERVVNQTSLEVEVSNKVEEATGTSALTTCPNTLPMREGATTTCKVDHPDLGPVYVKVTVTTVLSDGVMFRIDPVS